jgi:hypothetical protein
MTLHSMEVSNESNDQKTIIKNDFKDYLTNRLTAYKKSAFSFDDINDMESTYFKMTNKKKFSFLSKCLHRDVCDEEGNNFVHRAAENRDIKMIEWVMRHMQRPLSTRNIAGKEPIDLCIDQLMPDAEEKHKEEVYKVFAALITGYDKSGFDYEHRRCFLKKIVTLEFEHTKHGSTNFCLREDISKYFSGQSSDKPVVLSEIYKEVCDENGNTFTHMLVSHHLSDMLYKFIHKDYITFAQNQNDKMNPLTLAQNIFLKVADNLFEQCTNKNFNIATASQEDNGKNKKCCYYMLLNVCKKQQNAEFKQCCDKHIIATN